MRRYWKKNFLKTGVILSTFFLMPSCSAETLSLNLDEAVRLALENNRAIEQREEDREAARWNLSAIRRSSGLKFSWSASSTRIGGRAYHGLRENRYRLYGYPKELLAENHVSIFDYPLYQSENQNSFSLSMPLYTGGQLENQRKSARYGLNSADLNLEDTKQQVKLQTAQAYYQALQYRDNISVQQEAINLLNEHLRTVQIQFEVGTVAMADVLATNVQLANSQQNLNTAQGNYENALAVLNNIMGLPADTDLVIADDKNYSSYELSEAECLKYALEHRPDGIAAAYAVKQAEASVGAKKSGFRPNVSAVVQGSMSGEGAFKADHNNESWSAGIQLSWNIFDNNVTSAQVEAAKAQQRKAESVARQQIEQIRLEIREAYTTLKVAEKNIAVMFNAAKQAEEQYLIAQVRYEEGVDTNLNVMNAQEKLVESRMNYYAALYAFHINKAKLEKAMGVPIAIDAKIYAFEVENGAISSEALKKSAQMPLEMFNADGKPKKRSETDIKPVRDTAEESVEPFTEDER
ncbi:MAG: TolC family protein [Selenomonadaceae bacterium]|nr:TolC family protein [Selenomonadaceae bacterium]